MISRLCVSFLICCFLTLSHALASPEEIEDIIEETKANLTKESLPHNQEISPFSNTKKTDLYFDEPVLEPDDLITLFHFLTCSRKKQHFDDLASLAKNKSVSSFLQEKRNHLEVVFLRTTHKKANDLLGNKRSKVKENDYRELNSYLHKNYYQHPRMLALYAFSMRLGLGVTPTPERAFQKAEEAYEKGEKWLETFFSFRPYKVVTKRNKSRRRRKKFIVKKVKTLQGDQKRSTEELRAQGESLDTQPRTIPLNQPHQVIPGKGHTGTPVGGSPWGGGLSSDMMAPNQIGRKMRNQDPEYPPGLPPRHHDKVASSITCSPIDSMKKLFPICPAPLKEDPHEEGYCPLCQEKHEDIGDKAPAPVKRKTSGFPWSHRTPKLYSLFGPPSTGTFYYPLEEEGSDPSKKTQKERELPRHILNPILELLQDSDDEDSSDSHEEPAPDSRGRSLRAVFNTDSFGAGDSDSGFLNQVGNQGQGPTKNEPLFSIGSLETLAPFCPADGLLRAQSECHLSSQEPGNFSQFIW